MPTRTLLAALAAACAAPGAHAQYFPAEWTEALMGFYNATGGPGWKNQTHWGDETKYPCQWFGVACARPNTPDVTVAELNFGFNNLVGEVPEDLLELVGRGMTKIDLTGNELSGPFPNISSINTPQMKYVYLSQTQDDVSYTGDCSSMWTVSSLTQVSLRGNRQLRGNMNQWGVHSLQLIDLAFTGIAGGVPPGMWDQPGLNHVDISGLGLTGTIGEGVQHMATMNYLNLADNKMRGPIPEFHPMAFMTNASQVHIQNNSFTAIPDTFFSPEMTIVQATHNEINGQIPGTIANATKMQYLYLGDNHFNGPIPDELCELQDLIMLEVSQNRFASLPDCLSLPKLKYLEAYGNAFNGDLPIDALCSMRSLELLLLQNNPNLSGNLTACVKNWQRLTDLVIEHTRMQGVIPAELYEIRSLKTLVLAESRFEGSIPDLFEQLPNLETVTIGSKHVGDAVQKPFLSGPFPRSLLRLPNLQSLSLQFNRMTGTIPDDFGRMQDLHTLLLNNNLFEGPFPPSLVGLLAGGRAADREIALEKNHLTGPLPDLSRTKNVKKLTFHHNPFSGYINPDVFNTTYPGWLDPSTPDGRARKNNMFTGLRLLPPLQPFVRRMGGRSVMWGLPSRNAMVDGEAGYSLINKDEGERVTVMATQVVEAASNMPDGKSGIVVLVYPAAQPDPARLVEDGTGAMVYDLSLMNDDQYVAVEVEHPVPFTIGKWNHPQPINFTLPPQVRGSIGLGEIHFAIGFRGYIYASEHNTTVSTVLISQPGSKTSAIIYDPHPTIDSLSPTTLRKQGCGEITIVGNNFVDTGAAYLKCKFEYAGYPADDSETFWDGLDAKHAGGVAAPATPEPGPAGLNLITAATYVNATSVICHIPLVGDDYPYAMGTWTVSVTPNNFTTSSAKLHNAFEVVDECPLSPAIHSLPRGQACPCDMCPCGSAGACNHTHDEFFQAFPDEDMRCSCDEGFNGTTCEICEEGRWGEDCLECPACNEPHGYCSEGKEGSGNCVCHLWWAGKHCGFYYKYWLIVGAPVLIAVVAAAIAYYWWRGKRPAAPAETAPLTRGNRRAPPARTAVADTSEY